MTTLQLKDTKEPDVLMREGLKLLRATETKRPTAMRMNLSGMVDENSEMLITFTFKTVPLLLQLHGRTRNTLHSQLASPCDERSPALRTYIPRFGCDDTNHLYDAFMLLEVDVTHDTTTTSVATFLPNLWSENINSGRYEERAVFEVPVPPAMARLTSEATAVVVRAQIRETIPGFLLPQRAGGDAATTLSANVLAERIVGIHTVGLRLLSPIPLPWEIDGRLRYGGWCTREKAIDSRLGGEQRRDINLADVAESLVIVRPSTSDYKRL